LATNSRWQTSIITSAARRPLRDRLLLRLVELADATPQGQGPKAITPRISQSTLAAMIGVSRENVNRALAVLAIDGLVRQEDSRYVLLDEEALRESLSQDTPLPPRRRPHGNT
jgi:CRP-like cAMP-binding protein